MAALSTDRQAAAPSLPITAAISRPTTLGMSGAFLQLQEASGWIPDTPPDTPTIPPPDDTPTLPPPDSVVVTSPTPQPPPDTSTVDNPVPTDNVYRQFGDDLINQSAYAEMMNDPQWDGAAISRLPMTQIADLVLKHANGPQALSPGFDPIAFRFT